MAILPATLTLEEALVFVGVAVCAALALAMPAVLRERSRSVDFARRREAAALGEERALCLLESAGYAIVGRQVAGGYALMVDGEPRPISLRADYVVARSGRTFVAEVKTGKRAPGLEEPATRRQLLEYRLGFAVDGLLLVDAETGAIRAVDFPSPPAPTPRPSRWPLFVAVTFALAIGAIATALLWFR
jgi:hypothetical protein